MASIIGVETLQHTNGTTAATIDSSGRMLVSNIPMCQAHLTTSNTQDTSNPYEVLTTPIKYDKIVLNEGSCYSASTGKFTAPVTGIYRVDSTLLTDAGTTANTNHKVYKNSTEVARSYNGVDTQHVQLFISVLVEANANDTIHTELQAGDIYIDSTGLYSSFNVQLIGLKS